MEGISNRERMCDATRGSIGSQLSNRGAPGSRCAPLQGSGRAWEKGWAKLRRCCPFRWERVTGVWAERGAGWRRFGYDEARMRSAEGEVRFGWASQGPWCLSRGAVEAATAQRGSTKASSAIVADRRYWRTCRARSYSVAPAGSPARFGAVSRGGAPGPRPRARAGPARGGSRPPDGGPELMMSQLSSDPSA